MTGHARSRRLHAGLCLLLLALIVAGCRTSPLAGDVAGDGPPTGSEVIFSDAFGEGTSGEWHLEADDVSGAHLAEGRLVVTVHEPNSVHYVTLTEPAFDDLVLEVDVTQLTGSPSASYGILLRMAGPQQFYRFEITGNGQYIVERHDGPDSFVRLTEKWASSPALQTGLNAVNHLAVVAEGSSFSFYANDQLLAEVNDSSYQQGPVALDAGTFGPTELQVAFDNVVISRP